MSNLDLTLSPAQSEITLIPSSTFTQAYEITNNSPETILLTTFIESWIPSNNDGNLIYNTDQDASIEFSLSNSDLKLNQDFTLAPNQKKQLVLKIKNNDSNNQDHYYTFFVQQKILNPLLSNNQNLIKIGSHLLISSHSQVSTNSSLSPENIKISPKIKDIFLSPTIIGKIYNSGQHYSQIDGQIIITLGQQNVWQSSIYPYTVLSQNSRLLKCLDKTNNQAIDCQINPPLWPGKYQIKISLNQNSTITDYYQSFYILPYSFITFIFLSFFILFIILKNKQTISSKDTH